MGDGDPERGHRFPAPCIGPDGRLHVAWSDQRYGSRRETIFMKSRTQASSSGAVMSTRSETSANW
jgi:hypothetical protein